MYINGKHWQFCLYIIKKLLKILGFLKPRQTIMQGSPSIHSCGRSLGNNRRMEHFFFFKNLTWLLICSRVLLSSKKQIVGFSSKTLTSTALECRFIYAILAFKKKKSFVLSAQLALGKIVVYSFNPRHRPRPWPTVISHKASCWVISILKNLPCVATCLYLSSPTRCN